MIKKIGKNFLIMTALLLIFISVGGCGSKEEKTATAAQPVMAPAPVTETAPAATAATSPVAPSTSPAVESKKERMPRQVLPWKSTGSS